MEEIRGKKKVIVSGLLAGAMLLTSVSGMNMDKQEVKADSVQVNAQFSGELTAKRREYVKQFAMSDGSFTAVTYSMPVHYKKNGAWKEIVVTQGFAEIMPDYAIMLVSTAERPDEIDRARAERATQRAEERLRQQQSIQEYYHSKAALARAMARLKASGK